MNVFRARVEVHSQAGSVHQLAATRDARRFAWQARDAGERRRAGGEPEAAKGQRIVRAARTPTRSKRQGRRDYLRDRRHDVLKAKNRSGTAPAKRLLRLVSGAHQSIAECGIDLATPSDDARRYSALGLVVSILAVAPVAFVAALARELQAVPVEPTRRPGGGA